jgi:hypothetical protein
MLVSNHSTTWHHNPEDQKPTLIITIVNKGDQEQMDTLSFSYISLNLSDPTHQEEMAFLFGNDKSLKFNICLHLPHTVLHSHSRKKC